MATRIPDPALLDLTAPADAEVTFLALRDREQLAQALVACGGTRHRLLVRWAGGTVRWDCSCGISRCPTVVTALRAAAERVVARPSIRAAALGARPTARIFYRLYRVDGALRVTLHVGTTPEPDLPRLAPARARAHPAPRFVTDPDRAVAAGLDDTGGLADPGVLDTLLATGRAYFDRLAGEPLSRGEPRALGAAWERRPDGAQQLVVVPAADEILLLPAPPWLLTDARRIARPVALGPLADVWERLREPLPLEAMADRWEALPPGARTLLPTPWLPERIVDAAEPPRPRLTVGIAAGRAWARFAFVYGNTAVPAAALDEPVLAGTGRTARRIPRAWAEEAAALGRLRRSRWHGGPTRWLLRGGPPALARFLLEQAPGLEAQGWEVLRGEGCPGIDLVDGEALALVLDGGAPRLCVGRRGPDLLAPRGRPVRSAGRVLLAVADDRVIGVPETLYRDVRLALADDPNPPRARLLALPVSVITAEGKPLPALPRGGEARVPAGLAAELRGYQREGLAWLQRLAAAEVGGLLADDMGLGKTLQALAFLAAQREREPGAGPALVVAPLSLLSNWAREAGRFTPELAVHVYHGPERTDRHFDRFDLVLTTYGLVRTDLAAFRGRSWRCVVLDEAQAIKNPESRTARAVRELEAPCRLCLSGTPMENHLGELWALLAFAEPGLLGDRRRFEQQFRRGIEAGSGERREALLRRIRPFVLRRTRAQVLGELPPLIETEHRIELGEAQRALYESLRAAALEDLASLAEGDAFRRRARVLTIITRLRQACCAPALLPERFPGRDAPAAKLEALDAMLSELLREDRAVLVFSQFTGLLELVRRRLGDGGTPSLLLSGATRDRAAVVERFQGGEAPVLLISLKAGGAGLNLTRADTVILLDPWWNPAVEQQAAARAHRLGQTAPVFLYRLIAGDTIEEEIQQLKAGKRALNDSLARAIERFELGESDFLDAVTEGG